MALIECRECGNSVSTAAPTCPRCGVPRPGVIRTDAMHPELAKVVRDLVGRGFVIEDAARSRAVLLHGNQVNHVMHAILSLLTLGLWLLVWLVLVARGTKPVRLVLNVDSTSGRVRRVLTAS